MKLDLTPPSRDLFFSKNDPNDQRWGDLVNPWPTSSVTLPKNAVCLMGYPDDEGITLNEGRPGAKHAPEAIRRMFYKMTPTSPKDKEPSLWDMGNLSLTGDLTQRHQRAQQNVETLLKNGQRVITLGGGHDYGFADMNAFCEHVIQKGLKPFVINFDAHLDVRPDTQGANSGTSFYKLLQKWGRKINFVEIGIQDWCHSPSHLTWAQSQGAQILFLRDLLESGLSLLELFKSRVSNQIDNNHVVGLSVDIDCLSAAVTPGASQVFPVGLDAIEFLETYLFISKHYTPPLLGIYEVSPPLDQDDRTAKMGAILIHQFLAAIKGSS